jgi:beta-glucanase (GH16 family)
MLLGAACPRSYPAQHPGQEPISNKPCSPAELGYELVWEDQFDGHTLDPRKWEVRGVGPRGLGFVSPEAVKVENGYLKLGALKKDGRILLGAVGTEGRFMTRFGYFECRAELQKSTGIWSAFWIQSPGISKGEDPAIYGAEIDIMESYEMPGSDLVVHNVHWAYGSHQKASPEMRSYRKGVGEGFHLFAVEWTPEKYVFFVDGYKYYEVTAGISQTEEYLILSMEISPDPKDSQKTVFPDVFTVDYVRVYQKAKQPEKSPQGR